MVVKYNVFRTIVQFHHSKVTHAGINKSEAIRQQQVHGIMVLAMRTHVHMCGPCNAKLPQNKTAPFQPIISKVENERWQLDLKGRRHEHDGE